MYTELKKKIKFDKQLSYNKHAEHGQRKIHTPTQQDHTASGNCRKFRIRKTKWDHVLFNANHIDCKTLLLWNATNEEMEHASNSEMSEGHHSNRI